MRADFLLGGAQEHVGQRLRLTGYQVALIEADRLLDQVFVAPTKRAFLRVCGGQLPVRWGGVDLNWDQRTFIRDTRAPLQEQGSKSDAIPGLFIRSRAAGQSRTVQVVCLSVPEAPWRGK